MDPLITMSATSKAVFAAVWLTGAYVLYRWLKSREQKNPA